MAWIQEIVFSESNFRTGHSSDTYVQTAITANYPTTTSQGNDVGWETSGVEGATDDHNDASGVDPRLAGTHYKDAQRDYRINLPNTGDFRFRISAGDHSYADNAKCEIFDNATSRGVLLNQNFAQHGCIDAQDVEYSEANWPGSNSWSDTLTFTSTICRVRMTSTGYWGLMHITVEEVGGGGGGSMLLLAPPNLLGNLQALRNRVMR